jgi:G3E family GTPase
MSKKYLSNKTAVQVMLETGDTSVLKKTDPAQREELQALLKSVQERLAKKPAHAPARPAAPVLPTRGQSFDQLEKEEKPSGDKPKKQPHPTAQYRQALKQQDKFRDEREQAGLRGVADGVKSPPPIKKSEPVERWTYGQSFLDKFDDEGR